MLKKNSEFSAMVVLNIDLMVVEATMLAAERSFVAGEIPSYKIGIWTTFLLRTEKYHSIGLAWGV